MGSLLFVTGGTRSGKSAFAERLASERGNPVVYIATLEVGDDEVRERIARHQERRPVEWTTIEAPHDLGAALAETDAAACVLIDCLSVWVSNRLLALGEAPDAEALASLEGELNAAIDALIEDARGHAGDVIVVSNEVGSGVVPAYPLGRAYRDLLGRANQRVSLAADRAWLVVAGRALELPAP